MKRPYEDAEQLITGIEDSIDEMGSAYTLRFLDKLVRLWKEEPYAALLVVYAISGVTHIGESYSEIGLREDRSRQAVAMSFRKAMPIIKKWFPEVALAYREARK